MFTALVLSTAMMATSCGGHACAAKRSLTAPPQAAAPAEPPTMQAILFRAALAIAAPPPLRAIAGFWLYPQPAANPPRPAGLADLSRPR